MRRSLIRIVVHKVLRRKLYAGGGGGGGGGVTNH